jgi:hypothetical protein
MVSKRVRGKAPVQDHHGVGVVDAAAGVVGQTIAGLVSLGAAVLVWTGLALSLRRFAAWRGRRGRPDAATPEPVRAARPRRRQRTLA